MYGIQPHEKAFLYKNFCLPKSTYALDTLSITKDTINRINISQNNLIRQTLGIHKYSHISTIKKALNIFNIQTLIHIEMCNLIKLMHRHPITKTMIVDCKQLSTINIDKTY